VARAPPDAPLGSDHGVHAVGCDRPRTVLGDDQLPPAGIEGGGCGLDGDLHLAGRGRRLACGRVDRAMADDEQGPATADAAIR
jgi:hypothetical protein